MADLREGLEAVEIPGASESEDRAWRLLSAEFEHRHERTRAGRLPAAARRAAAGLAALFAVGALMLSPAGAAVREWIGEAIDVGRPDPRPALRDLPAPGSLLVENGRTAIVVREDGRRRVVGDFRQVAWSPHGLYVAAATGDGLEAVTASGEVRWSLGRHAVADPAWSPNEGFRVAYRSGEQVRVVWGDGTNDARVDSSAAVAPAWQPRTGSRNVLAYVDRYGIVRTRDVDTGARIARAPITAKMPIGLDWTRDGTRLMVLYPDRVRVVDDSGHEVWSTRFPNGREAIGGTWVPGTEAMNVVLRQRGGSAVSHVVFVARRYDDVVKRSVFTGSGRFRAPVASPDGRWLIVGWPKADQWLFIGGSSRTRIDAVANIRRQFGAGRGARFPAVAGWCCQSRESPPDPAP